MTWTKAGIQLNSQDYRQGFAKAFLYGNPQVDCGARWNTSALNQSWPRFFTDVAQVVIVTLPAGVFVNA